MSPPAMPVPESQATDKIDENRSRWDKWAAKNALPKKRYFPRTPLPRTRFQKNGPMRDPEWKRFFRWAKIRTIPKRKFFRQVEENTKKPLSVIMRRVQKLSMPRHPRYKYQAPPEPVYPYSPKIFYKKPPRHDKKRPIQPITLPYWWANDELEKDFWRWMRFPISRSALKYKISSNIYHMAIPQTKPPKEHCRLPDREESPPRRVKMTPKQWQEHKIRLNYLADASFKDTRAFKVKC